MDRSAQRYGGKPAELRTAERRERLLAAGLELFGTVGHREASIDDICASAGLTKRYFYESFVNREALLLAVYDQVNTELTETLTDALGAAASDDLRELARAVVGGFFDFIERDRRRGRILFVDILGVSPAVDAAYLASIDWWVHLVAALAPPDATFPVPTLDLARAAVGAVTGVAIEWLQTGRATTPAALTESLVALFDGRLVRPGTGRR